MKAMSNWSRSIYRQHSLSTVKRALLNRVCWHSALVHPKQRIVHKYIIDQPLFFSRHNRGWCCHQQQRRWSSSSSSFQNNSRENPYHVLNVPIGSSYDTVKRAFVQAALQYHPDHRHSRNGDTTTTDTTALFIRMRTAFEEIVTTINSNNNENQNASSTDSRGRRTSSPQNSTLWKSDLEFQQWFREATNEFLCFDMNHDTRQEVIRTYRSMASGGRDRGGYWEMARQLAEREDAQQQQQRHTHSKKKPPSLLETNDLNEQQRRESPPIRRKRPTR